MPSAIDTGLVTHPPSILRLSKIEGRRSNSSISITDGGKGAGHVPFRSKVKVIFTNLELPSPIMYIFPRSQIALRRLSRLRFMKNMRYLTTFLPIRILSPQSCHGWLSNRPSEPRAGDGAGRVVAVRGRGAIMALGARDRWCEDVQREQFTSWHISPMGGGRPGDRGHATRRSLPEPTGTAIPGCCVS